MRAVFSRSGVSGGGRRNKKQQNQQNQQPSSSSSLSIPEENGDSGSLRSSEAKPPPKARASPRTTKAVTSVAADTTTSKPPPHAATIATLPPSSSSSSSVVGVNAKPKDSSAAVPTQAASFATSASAVPTAPAHRRSSSTVLKKQSPSLNMYMATTPITKHYQLNQQILSAFESHYEAGLFQVAYAMGLQFVETALLEIPKHGYFYSKRHERERMQSSLDAVRVAGLLGDILERSQQQGFQLPGDFTLERGRVQRLQTLAMEQVERASEDQYEAQRVATEQEFAAAVAASMDNQPPSGRGGVVSASSTTTATPAQEWVLLEPFLSCQDSISSTLCPPGTSPSAAAASEATTSPPPMTAQVTGEVLSERDAALSNLPVAVAIPFEKHPTEPKMAPKLGTASGRPSLIEDDDHDIHRHHRQPPDSAAAANDWIHIRRHSAEDILLEKALYLSGLEILSSLPAGDTSTTADDNSDSVAVMVSDMASLVGHDKSLEPVAQTPPETRLVPGKSRLQLATLSRLYHEDFDSLIHRMGRIRVQYADTFQGRLPGSTNGCTVIAPLLCIHHLIDDSVPMDAEEGLENEEICQVIDEETPVILQELRATLGLSDQAFLIPADVHDYLMENGQLHSTQFVTVVGGNIMDESHLQNLVGALQPENSTKLAVTLFFHEHVVAILKLRQPDSDGCWYDLIDSLPLKETVKRVDESDAKFCERHGLNGSDEVELGERFMDRAAVIRCFDVEALVACLRWYACSKFTDENIAYIDSYQFSASQPDFDPRVFQAFVWGTAPTL